MDSSMDFTHSLTTLPAEYWEEADSAIHGILVDKVSADRLVILSSRDIPNGNTLNLRIFYANEYELDGIEAVASIVSKSLHIAQDWKEYKYGLEFGEISEEDRRKLKDLLASHPKMEKLPESSDMIPAQPSAEKPSSPAPTNFDMAMPSTANCTFYEKGKCLKKRAFCDMCHTEDAINLVEGRSTTQKPKRRGVGPLTLILSKLSNSFTSTIRNH